MNNRLYGNLIFELSKPGRRGYSLPKNEFALVHRRAEREVGHGAQCGDVEHAVVRSAVLANQSGAVEAQYERQIEYSRVVHYVVVGALREGAVYIAERHQSVFSHSG